MWGHEWADIQCMRALCPKKWKNWREERSLPCAVKTVSAVGRWRNMTERKTTLQNLGSCKSASSYQYQEWIYISGWSAHMYIKSWMGITTSAAGILKMYGFSILAERNKENSRVSSKIAEQWKLYFFSFFFFPSSFAFLQQDRCPPNKLQSPFAALRTLDHPSQNFS